MDIAAMNTQAQETAQRMKRQFSEMTDEQIVKVTRFIVLSAHAIQASEAFLTEKLGPDIGLSGKGYELIFNECAKETLLV
jgi:hypothetical protein